MTTKTPENDRIALVTGASRGIGRAIALALADRGWKLGVNFRSSRDAAAKTVNDAEEKGTEAIKIQADLSEELDRNKLVDAMVERFGHIDMLVNNAGMAPRERSGILETSEESYDEVMSVNLKGPFFLTQKVSRAMIESLESGRTSEPRIVNISSLSAYVSSTNRPEYCISKAGLSMVTSLFADRLAEYGINVYEIRPGIIQTDMTEPVQDKYDRMFEEGLTPISRWGKPEEVAKAVVAIADGQMPYSTGEVINVDGGFHIPRL